MQRMKCGYQWDASSFLRGGNPAVRPSQQNLQSFHLLGRESQQQDEGEE